jgi:hypothetical protein
LTYTAPTIMPAHPEAVFWSGLETFRNGLALPYVSAWKRKQPKPGERQPL